MKEKTAARSRVEIDPASLQEDANAVAAAVAGNPAAYDRLIAKYQRRAVAVSYRLLGNIDDAMDVCQDAFVRAYKSLGTLQEPGRFGAWLMRIVSNLSLNFRRGRRQSLSLSTEEEGEGRQDDWLNRSPRRATGQVDTLEAEETQKAVTAAIAELPEQQRLALVMFAIEEMPQKEVAEKLDCSVEAVKWHVFQGRKKLKELLKDHL